VRALDDGADPVDLGQEILDNTQNKPDHPQPRCSWSPSVNTYCPEYTGYFE